MKPTQVARPWRTTARSVLQTLAGGIVVLGILVPQVVEIVLDEVGVAMPDGLRAVLLGAAGATAVAAGIVTRVMALDRVERWLRGHAAPIAADPSPVEGDGPA